MKNTILIIDDDNDFRSYLSDVLSSKGYTILEAENGRDGANTLKKEKVDVVITDMIMPEREGVETIMEIRLIHPGIKIIAMSGALRHETYLKLADTLGADMTLIKPFKKEELFEVIENLT